VGTGEGAGEGMGVDELTGVIWVVKLPLQ